MNVRFDQDAIRVRLRWGELHQLAEEGALSRRFPLSGNDHLEWKIFLTDANEPELARAGAVFDFMVPRREVLALKAKAETALRKKELLVKLEVSGVPLVLDVDYFEIPKRGWGRG